MTAAGQVRCSLVLLESQPNRSAAQRSGVGVAWRGGAGEDMTAVKRRGEEAGKGKVGKLERD